MREPEKKRFFNEVVHALALIISNPEAQPAAHQVAPTKKNNGIMGSKKQRILEALILRRNNGRMESNKQRILDAVNLRRKT